MQELTWQNRKRLWLRMAVRLGLSVLGLSAALWLGPKLISLFFPFLLALLTAFFLSVPVRWLHKRLKWSRKFLVVLLLLFAFGLLFALAWLLVVGVITEAVDLAKNWEELLSSLQTALNTLRADLSHFMDLLPPSAQTAADRLSEQLFAWLNNVIPRLLSAAADRLGDAVRGLPSFAAATLVFILASYFLAADWPHLRMQAAKWTPDGLLFFLSQVRRAFSVGFGGYVKAQLILSAGVFCILLTGFLLIREPYAILLAFLLAVFDFIPLIGAGTAMVPWALFELLTNSVRRGVEVMIVWGIVVLFRQTAEPRVLGSQTGLPPVVSLASVYVGMRLAGVWGMICAPVLCLVTWNVTRAGVFDNAWRDLRLAMEDIAALLAPPAGDTGEDPASEKNQNSKKD